jgi:hypothetical protein
LEGDVSVRGARGRCDVRAPGAPVREASSPLVGALRATCVGACFETRSTAAGPLTFFVLPKKVSKERRAYEDARYAGPLRCSRRPAGVLTRTISRYARATCFGQRTPETPAAAALLSVFEGNQGQGLAPHPDPLPIRGEGTGGGMAARCPQSRATFPPLRGGPGWGGLAVPALEDAEQRRRRRGSRPSTVRSTWRAAGAIVRVSMAADAFEQRRAARRAVFAGAPFFAYFLWQDKESRRPRGREAGGGTARRKPARERARASSSQPQLTTMKRASC